jgi:hypothetical protein
MIKTLTKTYHYLMTAYKVSKLLKTPFLQSLSRIDKFIRGGVADTPQEAWFIISNAVLLGAKQGIPPTAAVNFAHDAIKRCDVYAFRVLGIKASGGCNGKAVFYGFLNCSEPIKKPYGPIKPTS